MWGFINNKNGYLLGKKIKLILCFLCVFNWLSVCISKFSFFVINFSEKDKNVIGGFVF